MIYKKKARYKPLYKKFESLKKNVQNRQKLLSFKKKKWQKLIFYITKESKIKKVNCFYKFFDQKSYYMPKYNNLFTKKFKQDIQKKKEFNLFYGGLNKKYLNNIVQKSVKNSSLASQKINSKIYFLELLEKRLDVIIFRSNLVLSIRNARQLITHGHVFVNGLVVKNKTYLLKKGDKITFSIKIHKILKYFIINSVIWPLPPKYLQISFKIFQILIVDDIKFSNITTNLTLKLDLHTIAKLYN